MNYEKGRCVLGAACMHPGHELRPQHKCADCGNIVHALCGRYDEDRDKHICGCKETQPKLKEVNVDKREQMALVSTITQSTTLDESYKEIPRDYFITKDQKINKQSKLDGGEYFVKLRKSIITEINDSLKSMMIIKGQEIGLKVKDKKTNTDRLIQTYQDIGYTWKNDFAPSTASKINMIINSTFTDTSGYEYYLETKIMKKFKLKYTQEDNISKGSIARMIVLRKCELAKVINKRAEKTHQKKISKTRYNKEDSAEKRNPKKKMNSFCIDDKWYNNDGSIYDKNSKPKSKCDETMYYVEKIKELEEELKAVKEV